jgi:superoxide dismutase
MAAYSVKLANIKLELQKITHFAHVQTLKKELNRLTAEIRKRGESEFTQIEKGVRQVRARVQKLQKQIEKEVAKVRKQVKGKAKSPGVKKTSAKSTAAKTTAKAAKKTTRKVARKA